MELYSIYSYSDEEGEKEAKVKISSVFFFFRLQEICPEISMKVEKLTIKLP